MKENKLYIDIRDLIDEFIKIKKLINNKDIQIKKTKFDKYILIELIINIDLYIQQNHLGVQKIYQFEKYLNNNIAKFE